jgi:hypothetical protein
MQCGPGLRGAEAKVAKHLLNFLSKLSLAAAAERVPARAGWKAQLALLVSEILPSSPLLISLLILFQGSTVSAPWVRSLIG